MSNKNVPLYFGPEFPAFLGGYIHFLYQWKQEWILYRWVTKTDKTAHFEGKCHSNLLVNSKNDSMS